MLGWSFGRDAQQSPNIFHGLSANLTPQGGRSPAHTFTKRLGLCVHGTAGPPDSSVYDRSKSVTIRRFRRATVFEP
jgi:hypothetical protein